MKKHVCGDFLAEKEGPLQTCSCGIVYTRSDEYLPSGKHSKKVWDKYNVQHGYAQFNEFLDNFNTSEVLIYMMKGVSQDLFKRGLLTNEIISCLIGWLKSVGESNNE